MIRFLSAAESCELLSARDAFLAAFTPADFRFRTRDPRGGMAAYRELVRKAALEWGAEEEAKAAACLEAARAAYGPYAALLPPDLRLARLDGSEEPGNAHCRGSDAIVLHGGALGRTDRGLTRLLVHELVHLLTRKRPELRERLYAQIGFRKAPPLEAPAGLRDQAITNPDQPVNEYRFPALVAGAERELYPLLFSRDPASFRLEDIEAKFLDAATGELYAMGELENYRERVGGNTDYDIQPEEIVAENVTKLLLREEVPDAGLLARIKAVLDEAAGGAGLLS